MKSQAVLMMGALALMAGAAAAQDAAQPGPKLAGAAGCQTQARAVCAPGGARLTAASGDVLLSRGAGFAEIKAGADLVAGDRILVKQGAAKVALGPTCQTTLGANAMVTLVQRDGVLCAAQLSADPNVVAQGRGRGDNEAEGGASQGALITAGMVGLGLVGGLAISQIGHDDHPPISR